MSVAPGTKVSRFLQAKIYLYFLKFHFVFFFV